MEKNMMNTAYWCVLAVILMPYLWAMTAEIPSFSLENNLKPRIKAESYTGFQQRAYWAHLNALEAVAPFAAAVIIASLLNVPQSNINNLALAFVGFRIAHALAYIANLGTLRSLVWFGGTACMVTLFVAAA
jgi:uncharacterized MAPEG superfamily protein